MMNAELTGSTFFEWVLQGSGSISEAKSNKEIQTEHLFLQQGTDKHPSSLCIYLF